MICTLVIAIGTFPYGLRAVAIPWSLDQDIYDRQFRIIKGLDNQAQRSKYLCLIIKGLDNQAQKLNNQINQYPPKRLILVLGRGRVTRRSITRNQTTHSMGPIPGWESLDSYWRTTRKNVSSSCCMCCSQEGVQDVSSGASSCRRLQHDTVCNPVDMV